MMPVVLSSSVIYPNISKHIIHSSLISSRRVRRCSVRLIADEGDDHAVEIEEEHDKMETELGEGFPLVYIQLAEDLRRIQEVRVAHNLVHVVGQGRQVEDERDPVPVDEEEEGQESMHRGLGDDICVETVAEVDGVDVITLEITIHDREEDLQKQVDGIDNDRQKVQPSLTRHHDGQI